MQTRTFFPYSWHLDESEPNRTIIRVYGLDAKNKNICIKINNFHPWIYLELPEDIEWTGYLAQKLGDHLDSFLGESCALTKTLIYRKKLYYANIDKNTGKKMKFPFLFCSFAAKGDIKKLGYKVRYKMYVPGIGHIKMKMHEQDASPILQLTSYRKLPTAGWVKFNGREVAEDDKITSCDFEYIVNWKHTWPVDCDDVPSPLIMGFDIETNSSNPDRMPKKDHPEDKMFQISCIFMRHGQTDEKEFESYLLSLGNPDPNTVGNAEIWCFDTEDDLLCGFTDLIQDKNPNLITGYNIFGFDIPYMIARAGPYVTQCMHDFDMMGFTKFAHSPVKNIKWGSKAYGDQVFEFLDVEGRLFVDLLPIAKRDLKLSNYRLNTVAQHYKIGSKDPLSYKGIFKCYRLGMTGSKKGSKALGVVGKYCIKDTILVLYLFNKMQCWIGLTESAKVCCVPILYLYTQGQQIKVYSQIYKKCLHDGIVVEKDGYITKDDEHYQGAHVFVPKSGVYDIVVPFDFSSLYPTSIIAYNIDYSTLVLDESIPDSVCHVLDWEDHCGCMHDKTIRKSKPKYIMCCHRRYRFLKKPMGVLPTILKNLLDARSKVKTQMKVVCNRIKNDLVKPEDIEIFLSLNMNIPVTGVLSPKQISDLNVRADVLNLRQSALKVSANSGYGAMGALKGYLPFMPGAMATTYIGREAVKKAAHVIVANFKGVLIYGDTDSNYVSFPHITTAQEAWDYSEHVAREVTKLYPSPMNLAYEEIIYWRFMILTKKRYMSLACYRNGVIETDIKKKGVLLARRDNPGVIREIYAKLIKDVFNRVSLDDILYYLITEMNKICSFGFDIDLFTITKSVGNYGEITDEQPLQVIPFVNEKGIKKGKVGGYTVPILPTTQKERDHKLELKNTNDPKEYYERCLPPPVQLAIKMGRRGFPIESGTRIEYNITVGPGHLAKQYEKIEYVPYFKTHREILRIDSLFYIKLMANPIDEVLNCIYYKDDGKDIDKRKKKKDVIEVKEQKTIEMKGCVERKETIDKNEYKFIKNFILNQYKYRYRVRRLVLEEIKSFSTPQIVYINDKGVKTNMTNNTSGVNSIEEDDNDEINQEESKIFENQKPKTDLELRESDPMVYREQKALKLGISRFLR